MATLSCLCVILCIALTLDVGTAARPYFFNIPKRSIQQSTRPLGFAPTDASPVKQSPLGPYKVGPVLMRYPSPPPPAQPSTGVNARNLGALGFKKPDINGFMSDLFAKKLNFEDVLEMNNQYPSAYTRPLQLPLPDLTLLGLPPLPHLPIPDLPEEVSFDAIDRLFDIPTPLDLLQRDRKKDRKKKDEKKGLDLLPSPLDLLDKDRDHKDHKDGGILPDLPGPLDLLDKDHKEGSILPDPLGLLHKDSPPSSPHSDASTQHASSGSTRSLLSTEMKISSKISTRPQPRSLMSFPSFSFPSFNFSRIFHFKSSKSHKAPPPTEQKAAPPKRSPVKIKPFPTKNPKPKQSYSESNEEPFEQQNTKIPNKSPFYYQQPQEENYRFGMPFGNPGVQPQAYSRPWFGRAYTEPARLSATVGPQRPINYVGFGRVRTHDMPVRPTGPFARGLGGDGNTKRPESLMN